MVDQRLKELIEENIDLQNCLAALSRIKQDIIDADGAHPYASSYYRGALNYAKIGLLKRMDTVTTQILEHVDRPKQSIETMSGYEILGSDKRVLLRNVSKTIAKMIAESDMAKHEQIWYRLDGGEAYHIEDLSGNLKN